MNDLKTWLTFSFIFGGSVTGNRLLERFGSPAAVLSLDPASLLSEGEITERMAQDFGKDYARRADFILSACLNFGWQILTPDSPLYPKAFDKLRDRPAVLYALGDVSLLNAPKAVSVVGTRGAAPQAKLAAYRLGKGLSERGIFSRHILKNSIIPLVHGIPGTIVAALVGAIITERVYVVPGAGNLLTKAINMYDNGAIVGVTLFYALMSVTAIIVGDVLMSMVDPRISFTSKAR